MRAFRKHPASEPVRPPQLVMMKRTRPEIVRQGCLKRFGPRHMVNCIRFSSNQCNLKKVDKTAESGLRVYYPDDYEQRLAELGSQGRGNVPGVKALSQGRVHLDIACMLLRRRWAAKAGPLFRYVGIDASPQRPGLEVLATVERVIVRAHVHTAAQPGQPKPAVEIRRMPVVLLGHGRCGLAEKVQAHIHQTWLEYGPSLAQVRAANADVRQVVSDMGTELAIADYHDVVTECLIPKKEQGEQLAIEAQPAAQRPLLALPCPVQFLYPLALVVPGTQHILDHALREVLHTLPFWVTWQAEAKAVCQWLSSQGHREFLEERIPQAHPEHVAALKKDPSTICSMALADFGRGH